MNQLPRVLIADPFWIIIFPCNKAIRRLCPFKNNVGSLLFKKGKETFIQFPSFRFQDTCNHLGARHAEFLDSIPCYERIWIKVSDNNFSHSMPDQHVRARWRFTMMWTWLQAHINSGIFQSFFIVKMLHSIHFRMRFAISFMPSLSDDLVLVNDYTANHRIRTDMSLPSRCQLKRTFHKMLISMVIVNLHCLYLQRLFNHDEFQSPVPGINGRHFPRWTERGNRKFRLLVHGESTWPHEKWHHHRTSFGTWCGTKR